MRKEKIIEKIEKALSKNKRKLEIFIQGTGPYCQGEKCAVFVEVKIKGKSYEYSNPTGKLVMSNGPYGEDLIAMIEEKFDNIEVRDITHAAGTHSWLVTIYK
jgi:hypothetical protein